MKKIIIVMAVFILGFSAGIWHSDQTVDSLVINVPQIQAEHLRLLKDGNPGFLFVGETEEYYEFKRLKLAD